MLEGLVSTFTSIPDYFRDRRTGETLDEYLLRTGAIQPEAAKFVRAGSPEFIGPLRPPSLPPEAPPSRGAVTADRMARRAETAQSATWFSWGVAKGNSQPEQGCSWWNIACHTKDAVKGTADFVQGTLTKIIILVIVVGILALFVMSYAQSKAAALGGR